VQSGQRDRRPARTTAARRQRRPARSAPPRCPHWARRGAIMRWGSTSYMLVGVAYDSPTAPCHDGSPRQEAARRAGEPQNGRRGGRGRWRPHACVRTPGTVRYVLCGASRAVCAVCCVCCVLCAHMPEPTRMACAPAAGVGLGAAAGAAGVAPLGCSSGWCLSAGRRMVTARPLSSSPSWSSAASARHRGGGATQHAARSYGSRRTV
jgi:hypothetical protein